MKYYLQTKAAAGNWADNMGSNDLERLVNHARYLTKHEYVCRIVERVDTVIQTQFNPSKGE
jgi:hypothetical protein